MAVANAAEEAAYMAMEVTCLYFQVIKTTTKLHLILERNDGIFMKKKTNSSWLPIQRVVVKLLVR